MDDCLGVLLVKSLSCHQTGCHQSRILPQSGHKLAVDRLLEAQSLVAIDKLCVFQHFCMLAALGRRCLRTVEQSCFISNIFHIQSLGPITTIISYCKSFSLWRPNLSMLCPSWRQIIQSSFDWCRSNFRQASPVSLCWEINMSVRGKNQKWNLATFKIL